MSQWDDNLSEHPVHHSLAEFNRVLSQLRDDEDSELLDDIERLQGVHDIVSRRLETVDPTLAPAPALNALHRNLQQTVSQLTTYEVDRNATTLEKAHQMADNAIMNALQLPVPTNLSEIEGLGDTVIRIRRSAGQHLRRLVSDAEQLDSSFSDLRQDLAETKEEVSGQKGRLDKAISDFQTGSINAEKDRQKDFVAQQDARKDGFDEFFQSTQRYWEDDHKPALQRQLQQAEKIVSAVANIGMAGGYQRQANWARTERIVWQAIAVAAVLAFVGLAMWALWEPFTGHEIAWTVFSARLFIAAAVGVLAGYAGRQGDRQARRERFNRQMELELASIQPYIATLEDSDKRELTKQMAERFFGLHALIEESAGKEGATLSTGSGFLDLLKLAFLDRLRR